MCVPDCATTALRRRSFNSRLLIIIAAFSVFLSAFLCVDRRHRLPSFLHRQDAAAQLERKMAAMEACLAARRVIAASPEPPKTAAELMAEQMKAAVAAPPAVSSTGPAAGNGKEILLQVGGGVGGGGAGVCHVSWVSIMLACFCWQEARSVVAAVKAGMAAARHGMQPQQLPVSAVQQAASQRRVFVRATARLQRAPPPNTHPSVTH